MSDQSDWQEQNTHYITSALAWLRMRLRWLIQRKESREVTLPPAASGAVPAPVAPQKHGFLRISVPEPTRQSPVVQQKVSPSVSEEEIERKAATMDEAEKQGDTPPALVILSQRLKLSRFERDVLFLCVAMELDTRIASLCARAQNDEQRAYPTFALALALFDNPSWDVLSPERPLRYWRLIEINQPDARPLTSSPLRADERIVNYIKGLNYLDDRLASFAMPVVVDEELEDQAQLPPSQQQAVAAIVRYWQQAAGSSSFPLIQLVGQDAEGKQLVAYHAARIVAGHLYRIPLELLPTQSAELVHVARLWQRESRLLPLALYLDAQEIDLASPEGQGLTLNRFLAHSKGIFFLGTREASSRPGLPDLILDVEKPTQAEQREIWSAVLQGIDPDGLSLLASQFNLNQATILRIARAELDENAGDEASLLERLWDACRAYTRPRLDILAQRLEPKVSWEDLVLPDEETHILHQIADQVRQRNRVYETWGFAEKMNRGLGINALFAGESGTGKTMAAEVIAHALHLNLYRIDLSAVVSKYIGETEKNLRRLFDAAEDGGAILFFDEADALFGKRSEVKDSHDRYANIEINYLLQRMEAYRGLAVLATNIKSALDTAFLRRLRFIVHFPFPGPNERKRMWEKALPHAVPRHGLDFDRLARLNLTGGSIHNVALNAAFLAASTPEDKGRVVTMPLLLAAARAEFRKLERPINEADLRWQALSTQEVKA
jgi:hypothetical protein